MFQLATYYIFVSKKYVVSTTSDTNTLIIAHCIYAENNCKVLRTSGVLMSRVAWWPQQFNTQLERVQVWSAAAYMMVQSADSGAAGWRVFKWPLYLCSPGHTAWARTAASDEGHQFRRTRSSSGSLTNPAWLLEHFEAAGRAIPKQSF